MLCLLLADSLVVHTDETGWSINSVWAFLSEKVRVLFFGVRGDPETLRQILDPAIFTGLVDVATMRRCMRENPIAEVLGNFFRKAIKLTLDGALPDAGIWQLLNGLLEISPQSLLVRRVTAAERGRTKERSQCWRMRFWSCALR